MNITPPNRNHLKTSKLSMNEYYKMQDVEFSELS
ncbi:MAG: hypothetical protein K0Q55_2144 [Verrucomicrobia bacterium]|nr:hypothetical protein [Verrucomicrobiota bacterium]